MLRRVVISYLFERSTPAILGPRCTSYTKQAVDHDLVRFSLSIRNVYPGGSVVQRETSRQQVAAMLMSPDPSLHPNLTRPSRWKQSSPAQEMSRFPWGRHVVIVVAAAVVSLYRTHQLHFPSLYLHDKQEIRVCLRVSGLMAGEERVRRRGPDSLSGCEHDSCGFCV